MIRRPPRLLAALRTVFPAFGRPVTAGTATFFGGHLTAIIYILCVLSDIKITSAGAWEAARLPRQIRA